MRRVTLLLVAFMMLAPLGVAYAQAPPPETYVVQPGDTIFSIALNLRVDPWELAAYNGLPDMNVISVGQVLNVPGTVYPVDLEAGYWTVSPGDTLYTISYVTGFSVGELMAINGITNPNALTPGQVLTLPGHAPLIPPAAAAPEEAPPAPEEAPPAQPVEPPPAAEQPPVIEGGVQVAFGGLQYMEGGRWAEVPVTVTNLGAPTIAGGLWYTVPNPDGGRQWVTLMRAVHDTIPYPALSSDRREPLWHATVYTSDGLVFPAYVGCRYIETVFAENIEPTAEGGFYWSQTLTGGWFDCGNVYRVKPDNIPVGGSASAPLTIYLQHPREFSAPPPTRQVVRIDLEVFDTDGNSLGTVGSITY
jgi:LysM repeat protein